MRFRLLLITVVSMATFLLGTVTAEPASAATYATSAHWIAHPQGATLSITPSGWAQAVGISAASGVMSNALGIAGWRPYSLAVYNSLFEQLQCHLLFRFKTPYNLDTWRPSVSWSTELASRCNP